MKTLESGQNWKVPWNQLGRFHFGCFKNIAMKYVFRLSLYMIITVIFLFAFNFICQLCEIEEYIVAVFLFIAIIIVELCLLIFNLWSKKGKNNNKQNMILNMSMTMSLLFLIYRNR